MASTTFHITLAFSYGFAIGFVNSIPIGPISVSIIDTSFRKGFWQAFTIGLGALVIDILYCTIGVFGITVFQSQIETVFLPLGFPVLTFLGGRLVYMGIKDQSPQTFHPPTHKDITKNFSLGFILYLTNPLAIGFWVFALGVIFSYQLIRQQMHDQISFITGMAIGTTLWFFLLAKIVAWRRKTISEDTIRKISIGTGLILIACGLYLGYEYFKKIAL
ncbi:LysE family translocator [bacterium]|nr:LysE family translocator [bacterium]